MFRAILIGVICGTATCAVTAKAETAIVYEPMATDRVACVWSNGKAIASFRADSTAIWLILDSDRILSTRYLRLWCMYQNLSRREYLLEPRVAFTILAKDPKTDMPVRMQPESPQFILDNVSSEKTAALIMTAIGGAFRAFRTAQVEPTTITRTGSLGADQYVVNDALEKAEVRINRVMDQTTSAAANTASWYDTFVSSVGESVLRKNTMLPQKVVNGYVYFPRFADVPEPVGLLKNTTREQDEFLGAVQRVLKKSSTVEFDVRVALPADSFVVHFRPVGPE